MPAPQTQPADEPTGGPGPSRDVCLVRPAGRPAAVRTPAGSVLRLRHDLPRAVRLDRLEDLLRGGDDGAASPAERDLAGRVGRELDERRRAEVAASWGTVRCVVVRTDLGAELARALELRGAAVALVGAEVGAVERAVRAAPTDVVVWVDDAGELSPAWDDLDRLPARGTAWVRGAREGGRFLLDPLALHAEDPTSEQVRRRRAAASPAAPEMEALWQRAREGRAPDPAPPSAAARAMVLHHLLDLLDCATTTDDSPRARARLRDHRSTLLVADLERLRVTRHPVLPFPAPAPVRR